MPILALAFALATAALPAGISVATLAERATPFATLAECEESLAPALTRSPKALAARHDVRRGSLFNRTAGNISRCEIIDGEPQIVVFPKQHQL